jgi:cobalamin biosynthesis protein CbiG
LIKYCPAARANLKRVKADLVERNLRKANEEEKITVADVDEVESIEPHTGVWCMFNSR